MAKTVNTKSKKKDLKVWGSRILVFILAAIFILTSFISVVPLLFS